MCSLRTSLTLLPLLGAALALGGCGTALTSLEPAPGAPDVAQGPNVTGYTAAGVEITLDTASWPGQAVIGARVTPAMVTVHNRSGRPIAVRYTDFVLVGESGTVYRALPPSATYGAVPHRTNDSPSLLAQPPVSSMPVGQYAPLHRRPGMDAGYTRATYEAMPTEEMLSWALPEGVIEDGDELAGYLYFEPVDPDESEVRFEAVMRSPDGANVLARVALPLTVD